MTSAGEADDAPRSSLGRSSAGGLASSREGRVVEADSLFKGGREVVIAHRGQHYRLRITQSGKLILTK